jgi:hypothetical protein
MMRGHESGSGLSIPSEGMYRSRNSIALAIAAFLIWFAAAPSAVAAGKRPSGALGGYNKQLVELYIEEVISYQTLSRLWIGRLPTQDELNRGIYMYTVNFLLANGSARTPVRPYAVMPSDVNGNYTLSSSTPVLPFATAQVTPLAGSDGIGAESLALADFNGDGKLDVAAGNPNDYIEVLLGLGDGKFANSILALGQQPLALGAADLNRDKLPELLMGGVGGLAVFKNVAAWPALN